MPRARQSVWPSPASDLRRWRENVRTSCGASAQHTGWADQTDGIRPPGVPVGTVEPRHELDVLPDGVASIAADLLDCIAAEEAEGPGHDHQRVETAPRDAADEEGTDVLDGLEAGEQAARQPMPKTRP